MLKSKSVLSYSILLALVGCGGGGGDEAAKDVAESITEQITDSIPELDGSKDNPSSEDDTAKDNDTVVITPPTVEPKPKPSPEQPPAPILPSPIPEPKVVITLGDIEANKALPIDIECLSCGDIYPRIGIDTDNDEVFDRFVDYPDPLVLTPDDIGKKIAVWVWGDSDLISVDSFQRVGALTTLYADGIASQAMLRASGEVAVWGDPLYGADNSNMTFDYNNPVQAIVPTTTAYAVLFADKSIQSFGEADRGGDTSAVSSQLNKPVRKVVGNAFAFAAVHEDGSVTTWGESNLGGDASSVDLSASDKTVNVFSDDYGTFYAIKQSAKLVSWGFEAIAEQQLLSNTATIHSNSSSVVANNGFAGIQCFGNVNRGGTCPVGAGTMDVKDIYQSMNAFLAIEYDGTPTAWGINVDNFDPADFSIPDHKVALAASNGVNFALLRNNGTIIPVGTGSGELDPALINTGLPFTDIKGFRGEYVALREDGKALYWDSASTELITLPNDEAITEINTNAQYIAYTGEQGNLYLYDANADSMTLVVSSKEKPIAKVFTSRFAMTALHVDGSATVFGRIGDGGSASGVDLTGNNMAQFAPIAENTTLHQDKQSTLIKNGEIAHWGDSTIKFNSN
ncbi:hypothetical protein [Photobacterium leiognathi]|uniref:hypothetical protein n=1 Tax=Photobacterium leiognathi TaxID=553611 RepID=UPI0029825CE2|nr:hypothetical protein [Photobacterium leiognathi]